MLTQNIKTSFFASWQISQIYFVTKIYIIFNDNKNKKLYNVDNKIYMGR